MDDFDAANAQTINQEAIVWRISDSIYFANKHFFKEKGSYEAMGLASIANLLYPL